MNASADSHDKLVKKLFLAGKPQSRSLSYRSDYSPIPRKRVAFSPKYSAGTIVIRTSERRLYHVTSTGRAVAYGIGVGKQGFAWSGSNRISRKAEWPGWTPPARMRAREASKGRILPVYMPGGPNNPLGARAMYIGSTLYRIHGTNQPWTIGKAMSSGCIRMANDDVKHLYANVSIGTKVVVQR
ncbi:MAG: L,D-transpeptidase [Phyllobacterium sp.]